MGTRAAQLNPVETSNKSRQQLQTDFQVNGAKCKSPMAFVYVTLGDMLLRLEQRDPESFFPTIGGEVPTLTIHGTETGVNVSVQLDQSRIIER